MTVYNGAGWVADAVESIQRQSLPDFDFVIVNDGSTDATATALDRFRGDPRITVIDSVRIGRVAALNLALTTVQGDHIANLDADDLAHEDRLATLSGFMGDHPEVGLVGSACRFVNVRNDDERVMRPPTTNQELRSALVRGNPFVHSSVMMSRPVIDLVGGYDPHMPFVHDLALWVSIAERRTIATVPDVLAVKRLGSHAYFQSRASWRWRGPEVRTRWRAWRRLTRRPSDLPFVLRPVSDQFLVWARRGRRRR